MFQCQACARGGNSEKQLHDGNIEQHLIKSQHKAALISWWGLYPQEAAEEAEEPVQQVPAEVAGDASAEPDVGKAMMDELQALRDELEAVRRDLQTERVERVNFAGRIDQLENLFDAYVKTLPDNLNGV